MIRALLLASLVALLGAGPALGAEGWGYDLADDLMSPYCPGRALSECPSPNAEELRVWILDQDQAGRSRADVEEQLYGQFGEQLRQAPRAEGVGLVAYVIPLLLFVAGGLLVAVFLQRARRPRPAPAAVPSPAEPAADDEELERMLDQQLES